MEDCLSAMRGLDVDSPLFRSKIQIKQCTILAGMGKYEEALENCDTAVELRYVIVSCVFFVEVAFLPMSTSSMRTH